MQADGEVHGPEGNGEEQTILYVVVGAQSHNRRKERSRNQAEQNGADDQALQRECDDPGRLCHEHGRYM